MTHHEPITAFSGSAIVSERAGEPTRDTTTYLIVQSDCRTGWYVTANGRKDSPIYRRRESAADDVRHRTERANDA